MMSSSRSSSAKVRHCSADQVATTKSSSFCTSSKSIPKKAKIVKTPPRTNRNRTFKDQHCSTKEITADELIRRPLNCNDSDEEQMDDGGQTVKFTNVENSTLLDGKPEYTELKAENILRETYETDYRSVYEIDLRACKLAQIPNLEKFCKLRMLDVSSNYIKRITSLECCSDIRDLKLYDNRLECVEKLDCLSELMSLQLQHNGIKHLGRGLVNTKKLTVLRLDCNLLTRIEPKEIASLSHLTYLNLSSNKLDNVNALNALPNLEELILSVNRLYSLDITRCKKIVELDVSRNRLSDLKSLQPLSSSLHILNVSSNAISRLEIHGAMRCLQELYVSNNTIKRLTAVSKSFPSLEILDISHNKLAHLKEINALQSALNLRELSVNDNLFCEDSSNTLSYHKTLTAIVPQIHVLDGIVIKRSEGEHRSSAPLMRPMSASHVISSRQMQSQLDMFDNDMQQFKLSLEQKFINLRATVDQLPVKKLGNNGFDRPVSRCSRRSRIMDAQAFASNYFESK